MAKIPRPPLKSLIDHIDHIAKVAGVDHVGLGSDFDGVSGATPQGIDSAADLPKITQALLDRGYSAADIHKILGGNLMRVFREVERVSREMQRGRCSEWQCRGKIDDQSCWRTMQRCAAVVAEIQGSRSVHAEEYLQLSARLLIGRIVGGCPDQFRQAVHGSESLPLRRPRRNQLP